MTEGNKVLKIEMSVDLTKAIGTILSQLPAGQVAKIFIDFSTAVEDATASENDLDNSVCIKNRS